MKQGKLTPATKRLKQVIQEFGPVWNILEGPHPMQCFDGGDGFFIESMDGRHNRNVRVEWLEVLG